MANSNKKIPLIITLLVLVFLGSLLLMPQSETDTNTDTESKSQTTSKAETVNNQPTIATEWVWQDPQNKTIDINKTTETGASLPFTPESVFNALQAVKLDANGDIILDHDALVSLDETLERIHDQLDAESLALLQELIKKSLPGKAGEQTAKIVGDYYNYLGAKDEFSQISEAAALANRDDSLESVQSIENLYSELQSLREVHIGHDATASLFRISDANAEFMFANMKLEKDTSLTDEERQARQQEIQTRHAEQSVNINNWPTRYQTFLNAKQNILNAAISDTDKQTQVRQLLEQHFNADELRRIEHLGLAEI